MNHLSPSQTRVLMGLIAIVTLVLVVSLPGQAPAASAKSPSLSIVTKTISTKVAPVESSSVHIPYDQDAKVSCKRGWFAIGFGIVNTEHYLASSSFGPQVAGGYVVGPAAAKTTNKYQALCVKNTKVTHMRGHGAQLHHGAGTATSKVQCKRGYTALGNAQVQEFAPGFGYLTSIPGANPRAWTAVTEVGSSLLSQMQAMNVQPVYADVACVKVKQRQVIKHEFQLDASGVAQGPVNCAGGRRALGFGIELYKYTNSSPRDGWWVTPVIKRAQYSKSKIAFRFGLAKGASATDSTAGTKVIAHVICGKLA